MPITLVKHSELKGLWNQPHIVQRYIKTAIERNINRYESLAKMVDVELEEFRQACIKRKWSYFKGLNKELSKLKEEEFLTQQ